MLTFGRVPQLRLPVPSAQLRHARRCSARVPPSASLTIRPAVYSDVLSAARCLAEVFRAIEQHPALIAPLLTHIAYLDMAGQLSRRLPRGDGVGDELLASSKGEAQDETVSLVGRSGAAALRRRRTEQFSRRKRANHIMLVAENLEEEPGLILGCIEVGVVNVPNLLKNGMLDELEQWGREISPMPRMTEPTQSELISERPAVATARPHSSLTGLSMAPYIGNLAVSEQFRRRGIATALVNEAERVGAKWGYDTVCLHVDADNLGSRSLYGRLGYECTRQEPGVLTRAILPFRFSCQSRS
jgi:ribosomal protein S18 acetylase RimI-like enzyme